MKTNKSKSTILVYSRNEAAKPDIKLGGDTLVVDKYKHLGSMIIYDGGCIQEIRSRLQQAQHAFQRTNLLLEI